MSLIAELKRRNVFKVGAAYLALGWIVVQATATLAPVFHLPEATLPLVTWIGVIGFPFAVVFSWVFELTPEGLKRESEIDRSQSITHVTSKRLDYIIIGMLAVAMLMFAADRFMPRASAPAAPVASAAVEAPVTAETPSAGSTTPPAAAPAPVQAAAPAPSEKSIAVLPFVSMSEDKANEYFSDGISEELLNLLAKIPELKVAARTSSFAFKGKESDIAEIAGKLRVAHVLEGSVRKSGNKVRITAQLVRAADGYHLWSDTWDRDLSDIFAVQDEIAGSVVEQLKIKLLGAAPKTKEANPQAYALYLQARQLRRQGTPEGMEQAIALSKQALSIDPAYAAAWNQLSMSYIAQAGNGLRPIDEGYGLAREAVNKALASDPDYAPAHVTLGRIASDHDRDLAAAARHFEDALSRDPGNPDILRGASLLASTLGRLDMAIALGEYLVAHDPVNPGSHINLGTTYTAAGRHDEAVASLRTALSLAPDSIGSQYFIGVTLLLKGDKEAALAEALKEKSEGWRLLGLVVAYHAVGRTSESDAALAELIQKHGASGAYNIAYVLAYRGEADRAFEWLDKAVAYGDPGLSEIVLEPQFANIHNDPRWLPFLRKIGYAPEQLAAIKFDVKMPQQ